MTHAIQQFEGFVSRLAAEPEPKDRLFMAAGLLELMRRAHHPDTLISMAELLASLPADIKWSRIPFSVTQAFLGAEAKKRATAAGVSEENLSEVLLAAFILFIDFVVSDVELNDAVAGQCIDFAAQDFVDKQRKPPPSRGPELFNENLVPRVYKRKLLSADKLTTLGAHAVYYRGELPGAKLGPDLRGLMINTKIGDHPLHILLETGEYIRAKESILTLAVIDNPAEYKDFPCSVSLCAQLASVNLFTAGAINKEQETELHGGLLGSILGQQHNVTVSTQDLQPLEHVFNRVRDSFDGMDWATGPTGASVRFPVPDTDMAVVIDARQSAQGPYAVSRLVKTNGEDSDTVIMRHDTPRLLTTRGVYIFPTKDSGLVSLTAIF
jgi:hypothetical protein